MLFARSFHPSHFSNKCQPRIQVQVKYIFCYKPAACSVTGDSGPQMCCAIPACLVTGAVCFHRCHREAI